MKVAITVTAVFDLPDEVEVEDYIGEDGALMPHFVVKDRKFRPIVEFDIVDDDDLDESDDEELSEIYEILDDSLCAEQYTIIDLDGAEADD